MKKRDNSKNRKKGLENFKKKHNIPKDVVVVEHKRVDKKLLALRRKQKIYLKELFDVALNFQACAVKTGIPKTAHNRWVLEDDWYAKRYRQVREGMLDSVETEIFKKIFVEGDGQMMRYYMDAQGQERGYGRNKMPNVAIQTNLNVAPGQGKGMQDLDDNELDELLLKLQSRVNEHSQKGETGESQKTTG